MILPFARNAATPPSSTSRDGQPPLAQIQRGLSEHFQAAVHLFPVSRRVNSLVYKATVSSSTPFHLAVKYCRDPLTGEPDIRVASQQVAAFRRIDDAFRLAKPELQVPRLLWHNEHMAAIGMAWIDGEALTRRLKNPLALRSLTAGFERAGAWLGHFHRLGPVRVGRFNYAERREDVERQAAKPYPHPVFTRAAAALASHGESLSHHAVQISWLHGDCKADNFLLSGHATYGIDISVAHENCVEHDLAQFLNHLSVLLASLRFLHAATKRPSLEAAFMSGYTSTGPAVSSVQAWVRLWALMNLWRSTAEARPRGRLSIRLVDHVFAQVCQRLVSQLEDDGLSASDAGNIMRNPDQMH